MAVVDEFRRGPAELHEQRRKPERLVGFDALRGLAVLLMVLDHALVAGPGLVPGTALRMTVTRASLPLFCVVAGALVCERSWKPRRMATIVAAGVAATVLGIPVGIGQPDVLLVLAGVLAVAPLARRAPVLWFVVAVLQPVTWPMDWGGYEPGTVLALVLLGAQLQPWSLDQLGRRLPLWLAAVGRRPLLWYVGHLAVLAAVVSL